MAQGVYLDEDGLQLSLMRIEVRIAGQDILILHHGCADGDAFRVVNLSHAVWCFTLELGIVELMSPIDASVHFETAVSQL